MICWRFIHLVTYQLRHFNYRRGDSCRAFASHAGDQRSIPDRDRPKSIIQAVTAALPNARQQVWVSRVLGDDHYKRMPRVIVGVAR